MGKSIEFDLKGLEKELDLIQKVHLPEAGRQALKSFGFEARELLQREMAAKYNSATPFTLKSPYFKQDGLTLTIGINDKANGVAPNRYLWPTDKTNGYARKEIAPTSFAGALRARYGIEAIPVPVRSSRAGRQFLDKRGNLRPRKIQSLLDNLESGAGRENYFLIKPGTNQHLPAGIYRRYRVKNAISMAFALMDQPPTQGTVLDFQGVLEEAARTKLPALIQKKLDRILR